MFKWFRKQTSSHNTWSVTIVNICEMLDLYRERWFKFIRNQSKNANINLTIINLVGPPLYEVKTYQLYIVVTAIACHQYIKPEDGKDFTSLLQDHVLGKDINVCKEFYMRYLNFIGNPKPATELFMQNMTKHLLGITEEENPERFVRVNGILHIATDVFIPQMISCVAECFGDKKTFDEQQSIMDRIIKSYAKLGKSGM